MNQVEEMLERYKQIRARLRYPPNAVPDTGINLRSRYTIPPPPEPIPEKIEQKTLPSSEPLLKGLTFSSTLQITAEEFGITPQQIRSRTRRECIARPRQIAIYLAVTKHGRNLSWVGRYLNLDHTTVIHARNKIKDLLSCDPKLKDRVDALENKIALRTGVTLSPDYKSYLEEKPNGHVSQPKIPPVD